MFTNKKNIMLVLTLIILLSLFYFSFLPLIAPDSTDYFTIKNILNGTVPIEKWWSLRGPTLPAVLYVITNIFGDNPIGFLIGTFLFYIVMIIGIMLIAKQVVEQFDSKPVRIFTYFAIIILIVFNPLIIGYYHAMLTEFVATTVAVISCLFAYWWIDVRYEKDSRYKYVFFVLGFSILTSAMWLLKQPYVTVAALPFLIASIISMIRMSDTLNILSKTVGLIFCLAFTVVVSVSWLNYLCSKTDCSNRGDASGYFSRGLVNGMSYLRKVDDAEAKEIINNNSQKSGLLDGNERTLIASILEGKSIYKSYDIYEVYGGTTIDLMVAPSASSDNSLSNKESVNFVLKVMGRHPYILAKSYVKNYLAAINVISCTIEDGVYYPDSRYYFLSNGENLAIGYEVYTTRLIYRWPVGVERPEMANVFANYNVINKPNSIALGIYSLLKSPGLGLFTLTFLLVPFLFIYSLVELIRNKIRKKSIKASKLNELLVILFGFSFLHVVLHILTGAIIDRYAAVAYPTALLGLVLFVGSFFRSKKSKEPALKHTSNKILFVIPAHNEESNIKAVVTDIKKNVSEADILVVDDYSSDNTKNIVEGLGVKCISMPFNVKYAMAVQTGIRYAFENNYGYVIQFDADGQHLAKEAKKLLVELKKTDSDIVIGSRFLKKTRYEHGAARMIGTRIFSNIINLFCGQRITDPTSGLQCINSRVIEKYSTIGVYPEYPDANLIIDMLFRGYKIREVSVVMEQRENGESMHSGIWKPIKYMVKVLYAIFVITLRNIEFGRGIK